MASCFSISRKSKDTISKIKHTALFQNLMKTSLKSSSTIYDYVKVQQLDDICQISAIVESSSSLPQEITAAEDVGYRKRMQLN